MEENLQGGNETNLFAGYRVFCNGSPERLLVFNDWDMFPEFCLIFYICDMGLNLGFLVSSTWKCRFGWPNHVLCLIRF